MTETVEEFLARGGAIKELDAVTTKEIIQKEEKRPVKTIINKADKR